MGATAPTSPGSGRSRTRLSARGWTSLRRTSLHAALVAAACALGTLAGGALRIPGSACAILWPPGAVLLTAFLLSPPRRWGLYLAGGLAGQLLAHAAAPLSAPVLAFLHGAAPAVLAAWLLRRAGSRPFRLDRLRDTAVFVAMAMAAPAATAALALLARPDASGTRWWAGLASNSLAFLLLTPPLAAAYRAAAAGRLVPEPRRGLEAALLFAGLGATCVVANGAGEAFLLHHALLLAPLPFLLWAGMRFGAPGAGASLAVLAAGAAWGVLHGHGPFARVSADDVIFSIQGFLLASALPVFFVAALQRERDAAEAALRASESRKRAILSALPDMIFLLDRAGRYVGYHAPGGGTRVPPGEFLGRRMDAVLPPELAAALARCVDEALEGGGPSVAEYALEVEGRVRHYEARVVRCGTDRVLSIVRDVSARAAAEAAVAQREEELRRSHAEARVLGQRLITAQEEERRRIARDLHDDLGQQLAALSLAIGRLAQRLPEGPGERGEWPVERVQERIATLAGGLRALSHQLHPVVLEYAGLAPALRSHCEEVQRLTGVACRLDLSGEIGPLAPEVALGTFRVAQEALRNVISHAGATVAHVSVSVTPRGLRLRVRDDGAGFDPSTAWESPGLGLVSMRERAGLLGGTLRVRSRPGAGTVVEARIPLDRAVSES